MIVKPIAGTAMYIIIMLFLIRFRKKGRISAERMIRLTAGGIFGALFSTVVGLIVGIGGHLRGWRPAGSLLSLAFSAWIMKGLTEQAAKYFCLRMNRKSEEFLTWNDAVYFGAVIGAGFGLGKGIAEMFESGNLLLGVIRELIPVHFLAGVWTGYLFGKGIQRKKPAYSFLAFLIPGLTAGLYEFIVSYHFAENHLWFFTAAGILLMGAGTAVTVLCMLRWNNRKEMNQYLSI